MATINPNVSTAEQIVTLACDLAQRRGFNAFSYRDLAAEIGIRAASIHHHFPTKADLGNAMVRRYREQFSARLEEIDAAASSPAERLRRFVALYQRTARSECGVCLGGVLAAELLTLDPQVRSELREFFACAESWLEHVLEAGRAARELSFRGTARDAALALLGALQGTMMVTRTSGDADGFDRTANWLLETITAQ